MNSIVFKKTANAFLNVGIVALYQYLERYKAEVDDTLQIALSDYQLYVQHENILAVLEEVYWQMGREVYDTVTQKQLEEKRNTYFNEDGSIKGMFPSMNTYGLTVLLTNNKNATRLKNNTQRLKEIVKTNKDLYEKITSVYAEKKLVLQEVYFEPYTKITRLDTPAEKYLLEGREICSLTGERFEKLVSISNTSPFLKEQGSPNFYSNLQPAQLKISWKAMYLSRFTPALCFYIYTSRSNTDIKARYDNLTCYLFESDTLTNLQVLYAQNRSIFKDKNQLIDSNYLANFNLYNPYYGSKNDDARLNEGRDYTEPSEILFMLIYTVYRNFLFSKGLEQLKTEEIIPDLFSELFGRSAPINLVSFRADKFASTLRPSSYETFNNFKFVIRLLAFLDNQKINFSHLLSSLKLLNPSDKNNKNKNRLERQIRNVVLGKVLKNKSILPDIESFFFLCFTYLNSSESVGTKFYDEMKQFTELYEPIIQRNMDKQDYKTLQERAINLGSSIGISVKTHDEGDAESNAKNARGYIIGLHKARTFEQFREAIIRFQTKYGLVVNAELLNGISEENFEFVKQFAVIAALNIINSIIKPPKNQTA